jgi:hypothetical protein
MERGLLGGVGVAMALFGGMFTAFFVGDLISASRRNEPGIDVGLIVFFGGMTAAGLYLAWQMNRARPFTVGQPRPGATSAPPGPAGADHAPAGRRGRRRPDHGDPPTPPANAAEREHRVLRLAERERGRVTVPEVAAGCGLTIAEAKAELDRLVMEGVADLQVTASGILVYVFSGFLSKEEKADSKDF